MAFLSKISVSLLDLTSLTHGCRPDPWNRPGKVPLVSPGFKTSSPDLRGNCMFQRLCRVKPSGACGVKELCSTVTGGPRHPRSWGAFFKGASFSCALSPQTGSMWRVSPVLGASLCLLICKWGIESLALPILGGCWGHCLGSGWENLLHNWRAFLGPWRSALRLPVFCETQRVPWGQGDSE